MSSPGQPKSEYRSAQHGAAPVSRVLVLGGTGFVGRTLCEKLVERAHGGHGRITVPSRRPHRARSLLILPTVELVAADVHDEAQLARLVAGHDAVVNLVATLHGTEAAFQRTHVELPRKLARVCNAAGVMRVVHVSALGVSTTAPSRYLRSKAAGEAVLQGAGLALTVLRPSVMFGAQDQFLNLFASLQALFPVMPLACADARFQPVWVNDVAQAIVHALDQQSAIGSLYECAGPQVYTLAELVRLAGRWSGHERAIIPLPAALGRLQATLMGCLPGEPLMSRDNLDSMRVPNVATGNIPGLDALGIQPTALQTVMPDWLAGTGSATQMGGGRRGARNG